MFVWRYFTGTGATGVTSEPFVDRVAAEAWLTANWEDLSERGIGEVELTDGTTGEVVYRMSLAAG